MPGLLRSNGQGTASNGDNSSQGLDEEIRLLSRREAADVLVQTRLGSQRPATIAEARALIQYAEDFFVKLEEVDMFEYLRGVLSAHHHAPERTPDTQVFKGIIANLARMNRRDLVNRARDFMPQEWRMTYGKGGRGQPTVLVMLPDDDWATWSEFPVPRLQDITDSD